MTGFGGAMAAALVLWMISGTLLETPEFSEPSMASIAMVIEEPRTVNLVFSIRNPPHRCNDDRHFARRH